jgi:hypothetical protein
VRADSRSAHVFCVFPRIDAVQRVQVIVLAELLSGASDSAKSDALGRSGAYQIETARALIAIEFFFIAVITFLSLGRCKRAPQRSKRAANQVIRRK